MSKRVILFGPLPPPYGGVSVLLSTLWGHVKDAPVFVWAYFGTESHDKRIIRFNHRRLGVIKALLQQGQDSRIIDFTHFHLEYPNPILLPIWLLAKKMLRFEWVKHVCDGSLAERYEKFTRAQKKRFKMAIANIDQFIVVNEGLRDWLINEAGVSQTITIIPSLLNISLEEDLNLSGQSEAALQEFRKHKKRVCCIGTFIPAYGFAHVADSLENLREQTGEDIGLLLLDGTFATDSEYQEMVLARRDWITVLRNIPNPAIYKILPLCDLFVRAFGAESYGISRVEAIWAGIPVIAVDVGETRGMITYDFGDVKTLTKLISEVLSGEKQIDNESWANRYRAEADENLNKFIKTLRIDDSTTRSVNAPVEKLETIEEVSTTSR